MESFLFGIKTGSLILFAQKIIWIHTIYKFGKTIQVNNKLRFIDKTCSRFLKNFTAKFLQKPPVKPKRLFLKKEKIRGSFKVEFDYVSAAINSTPRVSYDYLSHLFDLKNKYN